MSVHIDLRVVELLSSRLCHDLISPVGAVNNGMELAEEAADDPETVQDAVALAGSSARTASALLQFYRVAYGQASRRGVGGAAELQRLTQGMAQARKCHATWQADSRWSDLSPDIIKLALNMAVLAVEALPRGGEVAVHLTESGPPLPHVTAAGAGARVKPDDTAAMRADTPVDDLTPYTVQAHFTATLARAYGLDLQVDTEGPDRVIFKAVAA